MTTSASLTARLVAEQGPQQLARTVPPAGRAGTRQLGQHQADAGREDTFQITRQVIAVYERARGNAASCLSRKIPCPSRESANERAIGGLEHAAQA